MGAVFRQHSAMAGYYDGRYWSMWKLPLFGCSHPGEVIEEINNCKREYPSSFIRVIGFDPVRQVHCQLHRVQAQRLLSGALAPRGWGYRLSFRGHAGTAAGAV